MISFDRRRFLSISAAALAMPSMANASVARWTGRALGGPVSMQLAGLDAADAAPIFAAVEAELERLESIFSLYQESSELSRLNHVGALHGPSQELLSLLSLCRTLHAVSDGAFDPSIQPLWSAIALEKSEEVIAQARDKVGFEAVRFDAGLIQLPKGGALTLNGIAQGAVTDAITALLKRQGLTNVLVDMGEIAALGHGPRGPWSVGVALPDGELVHRLNMSDRAIATSVPSAMSLGTGQGHILTPDGQRSSVHIVSVSARNATLADGLSTALCLVSEARAKEIVGVFDGARIEYFSTI